MLRRTEVIGWFILAMTVALPLALSGATREFQGAQSVIAQMETGPTRIDWLPQGEYDSLVLTVSGPRDLFIRNEFAPGQTPHLSLVSDSRADSLPDGSYAYELRAVARLDREIREKLSEKPLVQSGHSFIKNGIFVAAAKPPIRKITENLTDDDLIITGNACIGEFCGTNSNDFSVLKLKGPQPNILFDDIEIPGIFNPAHDWALFINPFEAAQFSIVDFDGQLLPFSIEGGTPDNSLYISANGNLGLGTSTPAQDVHAISGNTPTIRLEQDGSESLTARTWDVGANEQGFFVRDVTNSSAQPFRIRAGAPASSIDIDSNGAVGIGTDSPMYKLHLFDSSNGDTSVIAENLNTGANAQSCFHARSDTAVVHLRANGSGRTISRFGVVLGGWSEIVQDIGNGLAIGTKNNKPVILGTNSTNRLEIDGSTGAVTISGNLTVTGSFSTPSSRELKEGFEAVDPRTMLDKFAQLSIQKWSYKSDARKLRHVGPTVEDFKTAFGLGTEGQYIFPMDVQGVTMSAVQGLYQLVQEKDTQIAEMQKELREIKQLLLEKVAKPASEPAP